MDYRKLYEEHYAMKLPKGMDVHHIDHDRENNNIDNLVALPSKLHHQYHFWSSNFVGCVDRIEVYGVADGGFDRVEAFKKLGSVLEECMFWKNLKDEADVFIFGGGDPEDTGYAETIEKRMQVDY